MYLPNAKGKRSPPAPRPGLSRGDRIRLAAGLTVVCLLLLAAVGLWLFRDRLIGSVPEPVAAADAPAGYLYDAGGGQRFAMAGDCLAVATSSGFELLDGSGQSVCARVAAMDTPAIAAWSGCAAIYDLGGRTLFFADTDGSLLEQSFEGDILSARVSARGYLAVVSRETGYRARVTVFGPDHREVYRWYSSSAWVLTAAVSPDSRSLAVLCLDSGGSEVRFFSLSSETQQAAFSVSDTVLLDLHWFSGDELCAFSDERALFFDAAGVWAATFDFGGKYLTSFAAGGDGFICFALSPYRSGSTSSVVSLDAAGRQLGEAQLSTELLSMDAAGSELLLLRADGAHLYSPSLSEKGSLSDASGFRRALLRSKGEALLLAAGFAEVYKF